MHFYGFAICVPFWFISTLYFFIIIFVLHVFWLYIDRSKISRWIEGNSIKTVTEVKIGLFSKFNDIEKMSSCAHFNFPCDNHTFAVVHSSWICLNNGNLFLGTRTRQLTRNSMKWKYEKLPVESENSKTFWYLVKITFNIFRAHYFINILIWFESFDGQ